MNHADHVRLLRDGIHAPDGLWADMGSGTGAFTLALAELLSPTASIYSIDRDSAALRAQQHTIQARSADRTIHYLVADFTQPLDLPPLDGIIMANALHFVREKAPVLHLLHGYLKDTGRLILVEYNTNRGNRWVPYPIAYPDWERLTLKNGFARTHLMQTAPSSFLGSFYSACSGKAVNE